MRLRIGKVNVSKVINLKVIISIALLIIAIAVGTYLRLQPVFIAERYGHGPTLYEMDPYATYWVTDKLVKYGLGYFWQLTRDNELTHIFWYPNGRDFSRTELPLTEFIGALTYPIAHALSGIDLYTWMVYLPVVLAALSFIGVYLITYEFSEEPIAAGLSALILALLFVDRQIAGFAVKYSTGISVLTFYIWLHIRAFKRNSRVSALLAGIVLGLATWAWAGYNLAFSAALIAIALVPLLTKVTKETILLWALEIIPAMAFSASLPFYHGPLYLIRGAGVLFPASLVLLALAYVYQKYVSSPRVAYIATLGAITGGGFLALISKVIVLKGKAMAAMGLTHELPVIVSTVAEYQMTTLGRLIISIGPAFIMALLALAYLIYEVIFKKNTIALFPIALLVIAIYTTVNMAYFMSYLTIITAFMAGIFIAVLMKAARKVEKKYFTTSTSWFRRVVAIALLVIFIPISIVYSAGIPPVTYGNHYVTYQMIYPTLLNSGLPYVYYIPAWYDALMWIKENIPQDAVVVAWWDYGYWISVLGERASVADGATLNLTQIRLLAQALTSPEDVAADILINKLKIPKDKLYVMVYGVYYVFRERNNVIIYPVDTADPAKAISAIIRIANDDPRLIEKDLEENIHHDLTIRLHGQLITKTYKCGVGVYATNCSYSYARLGLSISPNWNSTTVREALLFKMMIHGAYVLWPEGVFTEVIAKDVSIMNIGGRYVYILNDGDYIPINKPEMKLFKPAYIAVSKIGSIEPAQGLTGKDLYTVVLIYKYVGD